MIDIESLANVVWYVACVLWVGSFLVVAIDSAMRGISPLFWRLAALFGGPFVLLAYGLVRSQAGRK